MKKMILGSFMSILAAILLVAMVSFAASHPTSNYSTPPGAFLCTIDQNGMSYPLIGAVALFALGLVYLTQGYREKDQ